MSSKSQIINLVVLAVFYLLQIIFFRSHINKGYLVSDGYVSTYLLSFDVILLVIVVLVLIVYWLFPPTFTIHIVFYNSLLYGFTVAWLVIAGPFVNDIGFYFTCNFIIGCTLIAHDLHLYGKDVLYPKIRQLVDRASAWRRGRDASLETGTDPRKFNGKFHALGDTEEDVLETGNGVVQNKNRNISDAMHGDVTYSKALRSGIGSSASVDSNEETAINFTSVDPAIISTIEYVPIDSKDQVLVFEGFRLQIDSLSFPSYVKRKRGSHTNATIQVGKSNNSIRELPSNLEWSEFTHVEHCIDSSSCHIYTALWGPVPVILKLIKAERVSSAVAMAEFSIEESILRRVKHPHIVRFYGSGTKPRRFLVLERLTGGSLAHVLGVRPDQTTFTGLLSQRKFTMQETLRIAVSLSTALNFLHNSFNDQIHIIHRDIKPDNIGLTSSGVVKLFDFGLCSVVRRLRDNAEQYKMTGNTGTMRYMAPEVLLGRAYSHSVDAYSFGVVMWQIATGKVPFKEMGRKTYFDRVVIGGERLKLNPRWPARFRSILSRCWSEDKMQRPNFSIIAEEMQQLLDECDEKLRVKQSLMSTRVLQFVNRNLKTSHAKATCIALSCGLIILSMIIFLKMDKNVGAWVFLVSVLAVVGGTMSYGAIMSYFRAWPVVNLHSFPFDTIVMRENDIADDIAPDVDNEGDSKTITNPSFFNASTDDIEMGSVANKNQESKNNISPLNGTRISATSSLTDFHDKSILAEKLNGDSSSADSSLANIGGSDYSERQSNRQKANGQNAASESFNPLQHNPTELLGALRNGGDFA